LKVDANFGRLHLSEQRFNLRTICTLRYGHPEQRYECYFSHGNAE
jgi:hypothetical protein